MSTIPSNRKCVDSPSTPDFRTRMGYRITKWCIFLAMAFLLFIYPGASLISYSDWLVPIYDFQGTTKTEMPASAFAPTKTPITRLVPWKAMPWGSILSRIPRPSPLRSLIRRGCCSSIIAAKTCSSNMREIALGIELYNIEHQNKPISHLDADVLEALFGSGILKGTRFSSVDLRCAYYTTGDILAGGEVACTVHGTAASFDCFPDRAPPRIPHVKVTIVEPEARRRWNRVWCPFFEAILPIPLFLLSTAFQLLLLETLLSTLATFLGWIRSLRVGWDWKNGVLEISHTPPTPALPA